MQRDFIGCQVLWVLWEESCPVEKSANAFETYLEEAAT